jgi:hypothetical protein
VRSESAAHGREFSVADMADIRAFTYEPQDDPLCPTLPAAWLSTASYAMFDLGSAAGEDGRGTDIGGHVRS